MRHRISCSWLLTRVLLTEGAKNTGVPKNRLSKKETKVKRFACFKPIDLKPDSERESSFGGG